MYSLHIWGVSSIHNVVCRIKTILANHSRGFHVGQALGHDALGSAEGLLIQTINMCHWCGPTAQTSAGWRTTAKPRIVIHRRTNSTARHLCGLVCWLQTVCAELKAMCKSHSNIFKNFGFWRPNLKHQYWMITYFETYISNSCVKMLFIQKFSTFVLIAGHFFEEETIGMRWK